MTKHDQSVLRFMAVQAGASLMQLRDMTAQTEELHKRLEDRYSDVRPRDIIELAADLEAFRTLDGQLAQFIGTVGALCDLLPLETPPEG